MSLLWATLFFLVIFLKIRDDQQCGQGIFLFNFFPLSKQKQIASEHYAVYEKVLRLQLLQAKGLYCKNMHQEEVYI